MLTTSPRRAVSQNRSRREGFRLRSCLVDRQVEAASELRTAPAVLLPRTDRPLDHMPGPLPSQKLSEYVSRDCCPISVPESASELLDLRRIEIERTVGPEEFGRVTTKFIRIARVFKRRIHIHARSETRTYVGSLADASGYFLMGSGDFGLHDSSHQ